VAAVALAALAPALWDSAAGATRSVFEHLSQGAQGGNGPNPAGFAGVSADGSHVFFLTSEALADTDHDTASDLYERANGVTTEVGAGTYLGSSADGSRVFFGATEPLVTADTDTKFDIYQRFNGQTSEVSAGNGPEDVTYRGASPDGLHILFTTREGLLSSDVDVNAVDVYDRANGQLVHVTEPHKLGAHPEDALFRGMSADATHVYIDTFEELVDSDHETGGAALDVYELFENHAFHVSEGSNALVGSGWVGAAADASRVFFTTSERLDPVNDTDGAGDIYERSTAGTTLISRGAAGGNGPQSAIWADASADGTRVLFSTSEQLAPTDLDAADDLYERVGGETRQVSVGAINGNGPQGATFLAASADGSRVFFSTFEPLAATDTDARLDVYERVGGETRQVSVGAINGNAALDSTFRGASADGTRVFFDTAEALAATDSDTQLDVYERAGGETTLVSRGNGAFGAGFGGLSVDGGRVVFSSAERLAATDTDDSVDLYSAGLGQPPSPTPTPTPTPKPLPATAPKRAPALIGSHTITIKRGSALITLSCTGATPCRGSAQLASKGARPKRLGTARYRIGAGRRARIRIGLNAAAKRLVARHRLRATLTLREAGGPVRRVALTLRRR
jgi:hypothetical protein